MKVYSASLIAPCGLCLRQFFNPLPRRQNSSLVSGRKDKFTEGSLKKIHYSKLYSLIHLNTFTALKGSHLCIFIYPLCNAAFHPFGFPAFFSALYSDKPSVFGSFLDMLLGCRLLSEDWHFVKPPHGFYIAIFLIAVEGLVVFGWVSLSVLVLSCFVSLRFHFRYIYL